MNQCACGCGGLSLTARYRRGHNKHGQQAKRYAMSFEHGRLKLAHRIRAEKALGHTLPPGAVVHHADGYAPLVICPNAGYHALLHARMRVQAAGGNPNTDRICPRCKTVKELEQFHPSGAYCYPCAAEYGNRPKDKGWQA